MRKTPASPEAMRAAISVGDALVRAGYVSEQEMGEALARVKAGDFNGADVFITNAVRIRKAAQKRTK